MSFDAEDNLQYLINPGIEQRLRQFRANELKDKIRYGLHSRMLGADVPHPDEDPHEIWAYVSELASLLHGNEPPETTYSIVNRGYHMGRIIADIACDEPTTVRREVMPGRRLPLWDTNPSAAVVGTVKTYLEQNPVVSTVIFMLWQTVDPSHEYERLSRTAIGASIYSADQYRSDQSNNDLETYLAFLYQSDE